MAHKKGGGSSRNGRDSRSQRLGVKNLAVSMFSGNIIVRQHGTKVHPGWNVGMGRGRYALCNHGRFCKIRNPAQRTQESPCFRIQRGIERLQ